MAQIEDILDRLTRHANVAKAAGGAMITKGDTFYLGRLGDLDADERARVVAWCHNQGIEAVFGRMPFGGVNLGMRTNAENRNAETPKGDR